MRPTTTLVALADNDTVPADFADVVDTSCEKVIRKAPKSRDDKGENDTQSPSQDRQEH